MIKKPDFIVDPSGRALDVRGQKDTPGSGSSSQPPPHNPPPMQWVVYPGNPQRGRKAGTSAGLIFIPIGLIITLIIALCGLFSPTAKRNNQSNRNVDAFNLATMSYVSGDYKIAIINFDMAISSDSEFGEAYNGRGLSYEAMGDHVQALMDYGRAIELLANPSMAYNNRGVTYLAMGDYERAIVDFDQAIELDSGFAKAYYNRGIIAYDRGEYESAIADLTSAIQFSSEILYPRPGILTPEATRRSLDSLYTLFDLQQNDADLPVAYLFRGFAYAYQGDDTSAIADLQKAIELGLEPADQEKAEVLLAILSSAAPSRATQTVTPVP